MKKIERARMKIRKHFTIGYFSIVFPFFVIAIGVLHLLERRGFSLNKYIAPTLLTFLIALLCVILSFFTSYLLFGAFFSPLEKMSAASKKVAEGDYTVHIDSKSKIKEINDTIQNFNLMVHELNSVEIMRNDFIANVSHEFKTPLSSISGYVSLLQDGELSEEERQEYIRLAFFNIEKLNDLTSNILLLSKLDNESALPAPTTYRLDEQIREALVLLEPKWSKNQIELEIELQEATYTGQQALLFQVWANLIGNAIKFSHTGGKVLIRLENTPEQIKVLISDEGIGISKEALSHIFEKFYQSDTSRQSQGNGLGLALCKKILDICHGKIFVSSEPGKGAAFMVVLPHEEE